MKAILVFLSFTVLSVAHAESGAPNDPNNCSQILVANKLEDFFGDYVRVAGENCGAESEISIVSREITVGKRSYPKSLRLVATRALGDILEGDGVNNIDFVNINGDTVKSVEKNRSHGDRWKIEERVTFKDGVLNLDGKMRHFLPFLGILNYLRPSSLSKYSNTLKFTDNGLEVTRTAEGSSFTCLYKKLEN